MFFLEIDFWMNKYDLIVCGIYVRKICFYGFKCDDVIW